jgi:hypothetical protein
MASYEKRPRIDIKKFTVCSNVVVKCGTKTVDLIRNYLYEYDEFLFHLLSMNFYEWFIKKNEIAFTKKVYYNLISEILI